MIKVNEVKNILEKLTGQKTPVKIINELKIVDDTKIDYGQFNELLLLFGYDRVTPYFFQFLVDGSFSYNPNSFIKNIESLEKGVENFQKIALFVFGNVNHAYKEISRNEEKLSKCISYFYPRPIKEFKNRQNSIIALEKIEAEDTHLLGYLIKRELEEKLKNNTNSPEIVQQQKKMQSIIEMGKKNHYSYLISDHMDVYIATSMRLPHEYLSVNRITNTIFSSKPLKSLKLRWFDPTQAYCENRIDKGLSEALMLKRAKCTLYLAQESDTLGKDSELASTLAQGKAVIAYVPLGDEIFLDQLLKDLKSAYPTKQTKQLLLEQLKIFEPNSAWDDPEIRTILDNPQNISVKDLRLRLLKSIKKHYDNRADTLKNTHPLGIQVCLTNGVANGVLVVRDINSCIRLIRSIVTRKMRFSVETLNSSSTKFLLLKEKISNCIFRVITNDEILTNSFWNFYINSNNNI